MTTPTWLKLLLLSTLFLTVVGFVGCGVAGVMSWIPLANAGFGAVICVILFWLTIVIIKVMPE